MHKHETHETAVFTVFLRVYHLYIGFVIHYGLGAITLGFGKFFFCRALVFVGKALPG